MLRNTMLRLRGKHGLLAVVALAAAVIALGGSGSARAGFFTGNTTGFSSITADGQSPILIGGQYDLFLPSNYVQASVPVTVTAASASNKVSIGTQSGLVSSPDTFSVGVGDGATISICNPSASSTGDPNNCDHFNLGIFATDNFDTNLKALSASPGGISFTWSLSNEATSYSTRIPGSSSSVTINASSEDPLASVSINGVPGSSQSVSIPNYGLTNVPVKVTAADGTDSLTYTIAVTRGSNDATLSNLTISPGTITGFSPATTAYNVKVPSAATQVNITPTLDDSHAFWYIDLKPDNTQVQTENDSLPHPIALNGTDPTIVYVGVEAEDTLTYGAYFITITHLVSRQLNVAFGGSGNGIVNATSPDTAINCASPTVGTCTSHYDETSSVTLSETPAAGSYFVSWSGDCSGTNTTSTFTMPSRTATCTANFASLGPKQTSPFKVTTGLDLNDGGCYANRCSLRDALAAAGSTGGTITFAGGVSEIDPTQTLSYTGGKALTITGNVTISGTDFTGDGAILSLAGSTVTLNGITLSDGPVGGLVLGSGTLLMTGGGFEGNTADACAGFDINGTATMTNVRVTGNNGFNDDPFDSQGGGGCVEHGASLTLTGGQFENNASFGGGGIYDNGKLSVLNSQFVDNGWPFEFDTGPGAGAGIFVDSGGTAIVTNTTFIENNGADAFDSIGATKLVSSTVAANEFGVSGQISVLDSIVDENDFGDCSAFFGPGLTSLGHNLLGTDCPLGGPGDRVFDDAGLGLPTPSGLLPLKNGSPALDGGIGGTISGLTVPTKDATGTARPQGGGVDIGAMEMPEHKLTIKTAGGGTGTVAPDEPATPGGWYVAGSTVQLTATPTGGAAFAGWSGACTGNSNPTAVLISADETCTATFAPKPIVTSFAPSSGRVGTTVTITGSKFTGVTGVAFGDMPAASFKVVSDTTITAVVPINAATGVITVSDSGLSTDSANTFTYTWTKPAITSFSPASAKGGATVTLAGTDFLGTTVVKFGGVAGTGLNVVSDTKLTVTVPGTAVTGPITATNPGGDGLSKTNFTFLPPPTITMFAPEHAAFGASVTITGGHFTGTTAVAVSGVAVKFTVVNDGTITFVVPTNASAVPGQIDVTNAGGETESADSFTLDWATPAITSFTPATARIKATVTLTGTGFTRTSEVDFGAHAAPSFTVVSDTKLTAVVPDNVGTSPVAITVNRPGGTPGTSVTNFTPLWPAPKVTAFTPASAKAGATVTISGTGLLGETEVDFNGLAGVVTGPVTDTRLTVTVPNSLSATGKISVMTPGGTGMSATNFTFLSQPIITTFTADGAFGATVTITGSHFTGTSSVKIGGATATFHVVNDGQVTATVPTAASNTPGPISVTNANGTTLSASNFTLDWATPTITSFTPATARIRATVTLTGTNFTRASEVDFGSHAAPSLVVASDTKITVVVPDDVGTSPVAITVNRPGGTPGTSSTNFTPLWPAPKVTSFTPASAKAGATVTINGTGFLGASEVDFNGVAGVVTGTVTDTKLTVTVPNSLSATGKISVMTPGGTGMSATNFTFLPPPIITGFTGDNVFGATLTINGSHFTGTTSVKIAGATATFHVVSDTQITAIVPTTAAAFGVITVTNAAGTTPSDTFTLAWATPTITSFTPSTGRIGAKITITGTHFTRANGVMIGSTPATNVSVVSDTTITAVVPATVVAGAQHITVSNPGATSAPSTGTFTPTFPKPTVASFTPTSGFAGTTITITGTGFLGATEVDIGATSALTFTVVSDTKITVVVPTLAATGKVSVTTLGGTGTSAANFTIGP